MRFTILIIISVFIYTSIYANEMYKFHSNIYESQILDLMKEGNQIFATGILSNEGGVYINSDIFYLSFNNSNVNKNLLLSKSNQDLPVQMTMDENGNKFLVCWNEYVKGGQYVTVIKIDTNDNFAKSVTYGKSGSDSEFTNILYYKDYLYIFGATTNGLNILKFDTDLKLVWSKFYNFDATYYVEGAYINNDEIFISSWKRYSRQDAIFLKIDLDGNKTISKKFSVNKTNYPIRTGIRLVFKNGFYFVVIANYNTYKDYYLLKINQKLEVVETYTIDFFNSLSRKISIQGDDLVLVSNDGKGYLHYIDVNTLIYNKSRKLNSNHENQIGDIVTYNENELIYGKIEDSLFVIDATISTNCYMRDTLFSSFKINKVDNFLTGSDVNENMIDLTENITTNYSITSIPDLTFDYSTCSTPCGDGSEFDSKVSSLDKFELNGAKLTEIDSYLMTDEKDYFSHGALSHIKPVYVSAGFNSEFAFKLDKGYNDFIDGSLPGADGFSLVFHTDNQHLNFKADQYGGGMGFHNRKNAVALEIDLYNNDEYNDPDGNHIAFQVPKDGVLEAVHNDENTLGISSDIPIMKADGQDTYFCKLEYKDNNLKVWIDKTQDYGNPALEIPNFEFSDYLNLIEHSKVYVSLVAVTGTSYQKQEVIFWDWCSYYDPISSVEDNIQKDIIIIYPNPSSDMIFIDGINNQVNFELFDLTGRKIISQNYNNGINISELNRGIYILKLNNQNYKIIKE